MAFNFSRPKADPAPISRADELRLIDEAAAAGLIRRFGPGTAEELLGVYQKAAASAAARARARSSRVGSRQQTSIAEAVDRQRAAAEAIRFDD